MDHPNERSGNYDPASALFGMHLSERFDKIDRKLDRLLAKVGGVDLTPEEKAAFDVRIQRLEGLGTPQPPKEKT